MKISLRYLVSFFTLMTMVALLSGCFIKPYKFDLYQGNVIPPDKVMQIQSGMSREQVQYLLGTPVLVDAFEADRWDYVYLEKPSKGKPTRCHLAVFFDGERVARVTRDALPEVGLG